MSQINVTPPSDGSDRTTAAGINLIAVIILALVVLLIAYWMFTGPFRFFGTGTTNININPNVNPPSNVNPAPNIKPGNPGTNPSGTTPMVFYLPDIPSGVGT